MYSMFLCIMAIYLPFGCGTAVKCPKFTDTKESFPDEYCSEQITPGATHTETYAIFSQLYWDKSVTSE